MLSERGGAGGGVVGLADGGLGGLCCEHCVDGGRWMVIWGCLAYPWVGCGSRLRQLAGLRSSRCLIDFFGAIMYVDISY